jgi:tetratricopeptide (TPR) repeat protein
LSERSLSPDSSALAVHPSAPGEPLAELGVGRDDLAGRFRELRLRAGLTKTRLARPRYTVSYVSQIEAGRRRPASEALAFFSERLGVSPQYLATGIPDGVEDRLRVVLEEARQELRGGNVLEAEGHVLSVVAQAEEYELRPVLAQAMSLKGELLAKAGRVREAIEAYEKALAGPLLDREAGMTVAALARAYRGAGDLSYAAEIVESFLGRPHRGPLDPGVAADLQTVLVSVYFERGDVFRAERAAKRALAAAEEGAPLEVRARAYWDASRVLAEGKRWGDALELATRARILIEQLDDDRRIGRLHNAYAFLCLEVDPPRCDEAAAYLDRAEVLLERVGSPDELAYVQTEWSRLALLEERPADAVRHAERALALANPDDTEVARALFLKGRALSLLGRAPEAREALKEAVSHFEERGARQQSAACWREIGELDLADGDVKAAVASLRAGLEALDPRRSRA